MAYLLDIASEVIKKCDLQEAKSADSRYSDPKNIVGVAARDDAKRYYMSYGQPPCDVMSLALIVKKLLGISELSNAKHTPQNEHGIFEWINQVLQPKFSSTLNDEAKKKILVILLPFIHSYKPLPDVAIEETDFDEEGNPILNISLPLVIKTKEQRASYGVRSQNREEISTLFNQFYEGNIIGHKNFQDILNYSLDPFIKQLEDTEVENIVIGRDQRIVDIFNNISEQEKKNIDKVDLQYNAFVFAQVINEILFYAFMHKRLLGGKISKSLNIIKKNGKELTYTKDEEVLPETLYHVLYPDDVIKQPKEAAEYLTSLFEGSDVIEIQGRDGSYKISVDNIDNIINYFHYYQLPHYSYMPKLVKKGESGLSRIIDGDNNQVDHLQYNGKLQYANMVLNDKYTDTSIKLSDGFTQAGAIMVKYSDLGVAGNPPKVTYEGKTYTAIYAIDTVETLKTAEGSYFLPLEIRDSSFFYYDGTSKGGWGNVYNFNKYRSINDNKNDGQVEAGLIITNPVAEINSVLNFYNDFIGERKKTDLSQYFESYMSHLGSLLPVEMLIKEQSAKKSRIMAIEDEDFIFKEENIKKYFQKLRSLLDTYITKNKEGDGLYKYSRVSNTYSVLLSTCLKIKDPMITTDSDLVDVLTPEDDAEELDNSSEYQRDRVNKIYNRIQSTLLSDVDYCEGVLRNFLSESGNSFQTVKSMNQELDIENLFKQIRKVIKDNVLSEDLSISQDDAILLEMPLPLTADAAVGAVPVIYKTQKGMVPSSQHRNLILTDAQIKGIINGARDIIGDTQKYSSILSKDAISLVSLEEWFASYSFYIMYGLPYSTLNKMFTEFVNIYNSSVEEQSKLQPSLQRANYISKKSISKNETFLSYLNDTTLQKKAKDFTSQIKKYDISTRDINVDSRSPLVYAIMKFVDKYRIINTKGQTITNSSIKDMIFSGSKVSREVFAAFLDSINVKPFSNAYDDKNKSMSPNNVCTIISDAFLKKIKATGGEGVAQINMTLSSFIQSIYASDTMELYKLIVDKKQNKIGSFFLRVAKLLEDEALDTVSITQISKNSEGTYVIQMGDAVREILATDVDSFGLNKKKLDSFFKSKKAMNSKNLNFSNKQFFEDFCRAYLRAINSLYASVFPDLLSIKKVISQLFDASRKRDLNNVQLSSVILDIEASLVESKKSDNVLDYLNLFD